MGLKRIHELTHEELLELKDDGIKDLIKLEMAYMGVVEPDPLPVPAYIDVPKPTVRGYEVEGLSNMLFNTMADAQRVQELLIRLKPMAKNYTWIEKKVDYISKDEVIDLSIRECLCYGAGEVDRANECHRKNQKFRTEFEEKKKVFDEQLQRCNEIVLAVECAVNNAYQVESDKNFAVGRFEYYLALAKDDIDIAINFLKNAYSFKEFQWDAVKERIRQLKAMEEVAKGQAEKPE